MATHQEVIRHLLEDLIGWKLGEGIAAEFCKLVGFEWDPTDEDSWNLDDFIYCIDSINSEPTFKNDKGYWVLPNWQINRLRFLADFIRFAKNDKRGNLSMAEYMALSNYQEIARSALSLISSCWNQKIASSRLSRIRML